MSPTLFAEYTNQSGIRLRLFAGDIRDHSADVVIFGRNQALREHYLNVCRNHFAQLNPFYPRSVDLQANPLSFRIGPTQQIISTRYNPKLSTTYPAWALHGHLSQHLRFTLWRAIHEYQPRQLALVPLTWRFPEDTAFATVIAFWNLSVDAFFSPVVPLNPEVKPPKIIDVVSLTGIEHFKQVIEAGRYCRLRNLVRKEKILQLRHLRQLHSQVFLDNRRLRSEDREFIRHNRFRFEPVKQTN